MSSRLALFALVLVAGVSACRPSHSNVSDSSATSGTPNAALSDSSATSGTPAAIAPTTRSDSSATSGTPKAVGIKRDSLRRIDSVRRVDSIARATKRP